MTRKSWRARWHRWSALAPLTLLAIAAASCGGDGSQGTALSNEGFTDAQQCTPGAKGMTEAMSAFSAVNNSTTDPITLQKVVLNGPDNLSLAEAFVLPLPNTPSNHLVGLGDSASWPPSDHYLGQLSGSFHTHLRPLAGFVIPPKGGADAPKIRDYDIVLHLTVTDVPARFRSIRIDYIIHGTHLYQTTSLAEGFADGPQGSCDFPAA